MMNERILAHGENLNKIFDTHFPPITLCKKLRRLEVKATWYSEAYCNGTIDMTEHDKNSEAILKALDRILGFRKKKIPVFVNSDPRGYALKIKDKWLRKNDITLNRDWGGYGLLAPDLR